MESIKDDSNNSSASLESDIINALLSYSLDSRRERIKALLPKFSSPLKSNFENPNLWLRYGLSLFLSGDSPRSALEAIIECLRVDQHDPVLAMLAAKLQIGLDNLDESLKWALEAIERSQNLGKATLLSRCHLLTSIIHAHIYEREPESIRRLKAEHLKTSLSYLDSALAIYKDDYLLHFHRAFHDAKQRLFPSAIDNVRRAIQLNSQHIPSMQLLILSLSAMKLYDEAVTLCESTLHEHQDNVLLLYIKCHLEQNSANGCRAALETAKHILKCVKKQSQKSSVGSKTHIVTLESKQSTTLFAEDKSNRNRIDVIDSELSAWLLVADIFIKLGSLHDAELCVDEGSTHINGALSHEMMLTRGLIAEAKNNLIEAKTFFQSCLALCPRNADALRHVGHVHYLLNNYSTAEKFLKDSLDIDSDSYKTWQYLSLVYIQTSQHERAGECARKATILEESSPVVPISIIPRLTLE